MGTTVPKLVAVMVLSPLAEVFGVDDSVGEIWFRIRPPWDGVSTFKDGVRLSDALEDALLLSPALYGFSPWVSL